MNKPVSAQPNGSGSAAPARPIKPGAIAGAPGVRLRKPGMKLLFIHQNFPGQWRHLAAFAASQGHDVVGIGQQGTAQPDACPKGVRLALYAAKGAGTATHKYLQLSEAAVRRGQAVARTVMSLRKSGFVPDVVCAHQGWGEALYLKDVLPGVPVLSYCEFYYHGAGADVGFDPEFPVTLDDRLRIRSRNMLHALSLLDVDAGLSPTKWQHALFPRPLQSKIAVIHDGINTERVKPDPQAQFIVGEGGRTFNPGDDVITYVARNLEPYRGFHALMRALPEIQRRHPNAHAVLVGGDRVSYGSRPKTGKNWREVMLAEVGAQLDLSRVHLVGNLDYERYLNLLRVSKAHVYLTYPFVLSWSMLEAMATECLVIGSKTPPVMEVIADKKNGLLVDFFSKTELADAVDVALANGDAAKALRLEARKTILQKYDLRTCLAMQWKLVNSLIAASKSRKQTAAAE